METVETGGDAARCAVTHTCRIQRVCRLPELVTQLTRLSPQRRTEVAPSRTALIPGVSCLVNSRPTCRALGMALPSGNIAYRGPVVIDGERRSWNASTHCLHVHVEHA